MTRWRSWHYVEACRRRCNEHSETHCLSCLRIYWEEVQLQHSVCQRCNITMRSIRQFRTFSSHSMASRGRASCRRAGFPLSQNMLIYCWVGYEIMAIESSWGYACWPRVNWPLIHDCWQRLSNGDCTTEYEYSLTDFSSWWCRVNIMCAMCWCDVINKHVYDHRQYCNYK